MSPDNPAYPKDVMRFAYADPPYPGQAKRWYGSQDSYAGEVDHAALIDQLEAEFDGWALSTSAPALRDVLAFCPPDVRLAVWSIPDTEPPGNRGRWWWSWEPVIIRGGRHKYGDGPLVRNLLTCFQVNSQARNKILPGQKPDRFCQWILDLLGYHDGDELVDLFPGSGVMDRVLAQGRLSV